MRPVLQGDLHTKLANLLEPEIINYTIKKYGDNPKYSRDELLRLIFANYRVLNGTAQGIRLTTFGNNLMSKHYDSYKYEHNGNVHNKAFILLDKQMNWPYYLGKKIVTFYNENDAAWFRLNGNDINSYVEFL